VIVFSGDIELDLYGVMNLSGDYLSFTTIDLSRSFSSCKRITLFEISYSLPLLFIAKTSFKKVISFCNLFTVWSSWIPISCLLILYIPFLARSANFNVEIVSSEFTADGETVAISKVRVPP